MNTNNNLSLAVRSEENQSQVRHADTPVYDITSLEQFNAMVNQQPDDREISINKAAANSKFIPISYIQMKLDKAFVGLWRTTNFRYQVIVNELCGVITLEYFHPVARVWITREGSASVMIQQKSKDNGGSGDITNVGDKIKNTLQKDLPHLKASCESSAAKTIGKWFGRDLNRKEEDEYTTFYTDKANAEAATETIEWDKVKNMEDLKTIWNAHPQLHNNKDFQKTFTYRKGQLSKLKKAA